MKKNSDLKAATAMLYKIARIVIPSIFYNKVASGCDIGEVKATRLLHYVAASAACKV